MFAAVARLRLSALLPLFDPTFPLTSLLVFHSYPHFSKFTSTGLLKNYSLNRMGAMGGLHHIVLVGIEFIDEQFKRVLYFINRPKSKMAFYIYGPTEAIFSD